MISTIQQGKRKGKLSFPNKLIHCLTMILEQTPHLIKMRMILHHTQLFNLLEPQNLPRFLSPFPEAAKRLIIEYNKKVKVVKPKQFGGNPKPEPTLGKPNPKPQQVNFHENDHPPENSPSEESTHAMVHECLTDGGIDPSDIDTVMSAFKAKSGKSSQDS